jgi:RNA polymerase sigma-70 factor (ECF subfamily)
LVQSVREGNNAAFDDLVAKYRERVYHLICQYVEDPEEALDLTQETFIHAFEALSRWQPRAQFQTWLYRIAINLCLDYQRRCARRQRIGLQEIDLEGCCLPAPGDDPVSILELREFTAAFRRAVQKLPRKQQVIFTLRYDRDLSMSEIAAQLDCPEGTVKGLLFRARARLWGELEEFLR